MGLIVVVVVACVLLSSTRWWGGGQAQARREFPCVKVMTVGGVACRGADHNSESISHRWAWKGHDVVTQTLRKMLKLTDRSQERGCCGIALSSKHVELSVTMKITLVVILTASAVCSVLPVGASIWNRISLHRHRQLGTKYYVPTMFDIASDRDIDALLARFKKADGSYAKSIAIVGSSGNLQYRSMGRVRPPKSSTCGALAIALAVTRGHTYAHAYMHAGWHDVVARVNAFFSCKRQCACTYCTYAHAVSLCT